MAKIVFVGNCQVGAICSVYKTLVAPWTDDSATFVDAYDFNPVKAAEAFQNADILVGQVAETKSNVDIDELSANIAKYRVPVITAGFLWPFGGQPHPKTAGLTHTSHRPYPAELGDSYLNRMISKGADVDESAKRYLDLDINKLVNLDRLLELNLEKQRGRDLATGFRSAAIIEQHFRDEHIFLTPYHPEIRVARYLIEETFRMMNLDAAVFDRVTNWLRISPFPLDANPIHPSVQRHFGLKYAGPDYRYRFHNEGAFTFEQFVRRYLKFEWNEALIEGLALGKERQTLEAAAEKIKIGLQQSPQSAGGYLALSGVLERLGRMDEAVAAARTAAQLDSQDPQVLRHLGLLLGQTGQAGEAERLLRKAIDLSPGSADLYVVLSHVLQRQQRLDGAIVAAKAAVERDPSAPNALTHCAALLDAKDDPQSAERLARRAIARAPDTVNAHNVLSRALAKQNRLPEAIAAIRRALELKPDDAALLGYLGHLLTRNAQYGEAETVLRRALELSPESTGICNDLSHVLDCTDRRNDAIVLLRDIVARGAGDPHLRGRLGHLLVQSGDVAGAEREFRAAVAANPGSGFAASLADTLNRQGRHDEAAAVLRQAISRNGGGDAHIQGLLGHTLLHIRDLEGAAHAFRAAMERADDGSPFRARLADVLQRLGRREEAAALS
jgi:Flp pilus assembly protein TadD